MPRTTKKSVQKRRAQEPVGNQRLIIPPLNADPAGAKIVKIETLLPKAIIPEGGVPELYANHVQMGLTANDLVLDFYRILPDTRSAGSVGITLLQRVIVPLNMVKGLATALANTITQLEIDNNIKIPNLREPMEGEPIRIWE